MSLLLTERLIQRQLNHWNTLRKYLRERGHAPPHEPRRDPVLTVSRLAGSGGRRLAEDLAARLGLRLHDRSLVERVVREHGWEPGEVADLDERAVHQAHLWVKGVLRQRLLLHENYRHDLEVAVRELAASGGAVFLGRGAHLILGGEADLRVRVVASPAMRAQRLARRRSLDPASALQAIGRIDAERAEFLRKVFRHEPDRPEDFDLVLNSDRLDGDAMAEQVLLALASRLAPAAATAAAAP